MQQNLAAQKAAADAKKRWQPKSDEEMAKDKTERKARQLEKRIIDAVNLSRYPTALPKSPLECSTTCCLLPICLLPFSYCQSSD